MVPDQGRFANGASTPTAKSSPSFTQAKGKSIQPVSTQGQSDAQECIVYKIVKNDVVWKEPRASIYLGDDVVIYGGKGKTYGARDKMVKPASKGKQLKTKKLNLKAKGKE
jgi:hypothetical protein